MIPNYYPWDGLINRLRACDEHVAQLQEDDMAKADLDRRRWSYVEPDVAGDEPPEYPDAYDEHLLDKVNGDG